MPSIVIPRRQLVQPQGYAPVSGDSWLTYLTSAGINSLLDGRSLSNSGVALAIGNSGVAADIDAAADYLEYTPTTDIPDSFHLVAVVDLNASSTFSRLIESQGSSGDAPFSVWFAPSSSSGANGNPSSVVVVRNVGGGSLLGERWSTPANSLVRPRSGVVLEVIWGATESDTTPPRVWINGVEQAMTKVQSSSTPNAPFAALSGVPLRIGNRFGTVDRALLGKLYLLHVEQQSRTAPYINPWRVFKQSPSRLYFDAVAVGDGSITGNLAATESGSDTAAFVGDVIISGDLAATESGSDTAAFSGDVIVSGTLAATETGSDTAAFTGTVPLSTITGTLDATESGSDSASFIGAGVVTRSQHVVRYIYRPYSNATERKYIEQLNEDLRTLYGQIAALSRGSVSGHDARESAPVGGTWQQGDFVRKFSPTEQGTSGSKYIVTGWSCVASGSPGTWVECRVLTGN